MTNKKKTKSATKGKQSSAPPITAVEKSSNSEHKNGETTKNVRGGTLTQGQFTSIIFLALGVSKLMELFQAVQDGKRSVDNYDTSSTKSDDIRRSLCEMYLNVTEKVTETMNHSALVDETQQQHPCEENATKIWIRMKFHTGIQCLWIVITLFGICWREEDLMMGILFCLCICPLLTTLFGLVFVKVCQDYIAQDRKYQLLMLCLLLIAVSCPGAAGSYTFSDIKNCLYQRRKLKQLDRKIFFSFLPSYCLSTFIFLRLWDAWQASKVLSALPSPTATDDNTNTTIASTKSWTVEETFGMSDSFPIESMPLIYFWIVDQCTVALLLFFAWCFFEERRQRVFLTSMSLCKFMEYYYQLNSFEENQLQGIETMKTTVLYSAIFSTIAWLVPTYLQKNTKRKQN